VPSGAILDLEQALTQPQLAHRGTLQAVCAEGVGELKLFGLTAKMEKTPGAVDTPPPRLAEHTDEILRGLGYTAERIATLRQRGIV